YMFSQRGVVNQLMGEPQRIWVLSPQSMGIMKPEWAARATKIQGDAMAEVQGKIVAAAQQAMCDECQGKQKGPDEAPCWKCHGRRP
ncbi:MAG: hypothetical protein Q8R28_20555, partial [Dehalococcoidia bacterium]|nr:hypothetical protein [Dehalococcoidia bacterium]